MLIVICVYKQQEIVFNTILIVVRL